ncbi:MAG: nuclear transport factor 2 family protein, partial [Chthoniobacterales bacterium]
YAPDAFFNDTLKTVRGNEALEEYFLETAKNAKKVQATVQDVAVSGDNYYLRWVMDVEFAKFKKGQTIRTIGITHLRFDDQGRITLHQDFWDPAAGLYEHIPVLGGAIRAIQSRF